MPVDGLTHWDGYQLRGSRTTTANATLAGGTPQPAGGRRSGEATRFFHPRSWCDSTCPSPTKLIDMSLST
jgi:hypothetical protein